MEVNSEAMNQLAADVKDLRQALLGDEDLEIRGAIHRIKAVESKVDRIYGAGLWSIRFVATAIIGGLCTFVSKHYF